MKWCLSYPQTEPVDRGISDAEYPAHQYSSGDLHGNPNAYRLTQPVTAIVDGTVLHFAMLWSTRLETLCRVGTPVFGRTLAVLARPGGQFSSGHWVKLADI